MNPTEWLILLFSAFVVGFSKTAIPGINVLIIPMMASAFDPKLSVGMILPLLLTGDIIAVSLYHQNVKKKILQGLLLWSIPGFLLGYLALLYIPPNVFGPVIGFVILAALILNWKAYEFKKSDEVDSPSEQFKAICGTGAGFSTMVANTAGPIVTIYLARSNLRKMAFIATAAVYYLIVNLTKIPFYWSAGLFSSDQFSAVFFAIPVILAGAFLGKLLLPMLPEKLFIRTVFILAAIASLNLILS